MRATRWVARGSCLVGLMFLLAGCVIAPGDGYGDRPHHRYDHDHSWHQCRDRDDRDGDDRRCRD